MPVVIVVEDGSGKANANSFASVAFADQYFTDRGYIGTSLWPVADTGLLKESCLIVASQFIDFHFRERFKGRKLTKNQALCWPRSGAIIDGVPYGAETYLAGYGTVMTGFLIDTTEIPWMLVHATCELAARAFQLGDGTHPGILAPDIKPGDAQLTSLDVAGAIRKTWGSGRKPFTMYRLAEMIMMPLCTSTGGVGQIVRA